MGNHVHRQAVDRYEREPADLFVLPYRGDACGSGPERLRAPRGLEGWRLWEPSRWLREDEFKRQITLVEQSRGAPEPRRRL